MSICRVSAAIAAAGAVRAKRPIVNIGLALALASLLFANFTV